MNRNARAEKETTRTMLGVWVGLLALIFLRAPRLLLEGRIWAEEGTVYLQYAWDHGAWAALVALHQGYYSLCPNLFTVLAVHLAPVGAIALFLVVCSLAVQILAACMAITCEAFQGLRTRFLAAFLCLFSAPNAEVWLNSINSQFYLLVCVFLILISDARRHLALRTAVVLIASLTGPVSCFLLPLFIVRAWRHRGRGEFMQAAASSLGTLVQSVAVVSAMRAAVAGSAESTLVANSAMLTIDKFAAFGPAFLVKNILLPFGTRVTYHVAIGFISQHASTVVFAFCWLLALGGAVVLGLVTRWGGATTAWLMAAGASSLLMNYVGARGDGMTLIGGGDRYFFAFNVVVGLILLLVVSRGSLQGARRHMVRIMLALVLISALVDGKLHWMRLQDGPSWKVEIAGLAADPQKPIAIWPRHWEKTLRLNPAYRGRVNPAARSASSENADAPAPLR